MKTVVYATTSESAPVMRQCHNTVSQRCILLNLFQITRPIWWKWWASTADHACAAPVMVALSWQRHYRWWRNPMCRAVGDFIRLLWWIALFYTVLSFIILCSKALHCLVMYCIVFEMSILSLVISTHANLESRWRLWQASGDIICRTIDHVDGRKLQQTAARLPGASNFLWETTAELEDNTQEWRRESQWTRLK